MTAPVNIATDAYSFERYGKDAWRDCAAHLRGRGLTQREIEIVLRSKVMRWAADDAEVDEAPAASDLAAFLNKQQRPLRGLGMRSRAGRALS